MTTNEEIERELKALEDRAAQLILDGVTLRTKIQGANKEQQDSADSLASATARADRLEAALLRLRAEIKSKPPEA